MDVLKSSKRQNARGGRGKRSAASIAATYQKKTQLEHILLRPDTYVGSLEATTDQKMYVFDKASGRIKMRPITYVPGLYKIFDEILVNAADNRQRDASMDRIEVTIDQAAGRISVLNSGRGVPVEMHEEYGVYVPTMVFGQLLTSSNYNDAEKKTTGGRNGYGAKLTNIFSTEFVVETVDSARGLHFSQTFRNNMGVTEEPVIRELTEEEEEEGDYTRIAFRPDLERFHLDRLDNDTVDLMTKRVYDMAGVTPQNVRVYLNGDRLPVSTFEEYVCLYDDVPEEEVAELPARGKKAAAAAAAGGKGKKKAAGKGGKGKKKAKADDEWDSADDSEEDEDAFTPDDDSDEEEEEEAGKKAKGGGKKASATAASTAGANPKVWTRIGDRWLICVAASSNDTMEQVSFVNSICTSSGGQHVEAIVKQVAEEVRAYLAKPGRGKKGISVTASQVRNQVKVFINCLIENPAFSSQTKEKLTTRPDAFGSDHELPKAFFKNLAETTGIADKMRRWLASKQHRDLGRKAGKKTKTVTGIPKLDDANWAGTAKSDQCTLILTEGDSAKALAVSGLSVVGRDRYGVFPLKGKLLNVREATHAQLKNNAEIQYVMQILGLNPTKQYTDTKSLRYGHLLIMADQDHDGSHIKGLVVNFIAHFWPSLLEIDGFLQQFITPIVKVTKGTGKKKKEQSFFTLSDYEHWIQEQDAAAGGRKGWTAKYYKGLGTSSAAEAKEYFSNLDLHVIDFRHEGEADDLVDLAFSKKRADDRKRWLQGFQPGQGVDYTQADMPISDFINHELIHFSRADNERSIPSVVDGFKPSQRKVLFACFRRNLKKEMKVAQLAGYVAEHSAYHHGEQSLAATIVGMAQDFVGSNNIHLLVPAGQFGTRLLGGKDAASARYIFTRLHKVARLLFPEQDDALLKQLEDDGQAIEPEYYVPVIPMALVNGADGIGTGWSTSVPNYNPADVVRAVRRRLQKLQRDDEAAEARAAAGGEDDDAILEAAAAAGAGDGEEEAEAPLQPWWRGFEGTVRPGKNNSQWILRGRFDLSEDGRTLTVTELPVRKWTQDYKLFLEEAMLDADDKAKAKGKAKGKKGATSAAAKKKKAAAAAKKKKDAAAAAAKKKKKDQEAELDDDDFDPDAWEDDDAADDDDFEMLVAPAKGKKKAAGKAKEDDPDKGLALVKSFAEHHTDLTVHFTIELTDAGARRVARGTSAIVKAFRLETSVSTSNMHLFDSDCRMRKYAQPEDVIAEFFPVRLDLYGQRKAHLLKELRNEHTILSNKARFIRMVIDGDLVISRKAKAVLVEELLELEFHPQQVQQKKAVVAVGEEAEEEEEEEGDDEVDAKAFNYLLSLPMWSLTAERIAALEEQVADKEAAIEELEGKTPADLWTADLDALEEGLDEASADRLEAKAQLSKARRVAARKKPAKAKRRGRAKAAADDEEDEEGWVPEEAAAPAPRAKKAPARRARAAAKPKKRVVEIETDDEDEEEEDEEAFSFDDDEEPEVMPKPRQRGSRARKAAPAAEKPAAKKRAAKKKQPSAAALAAQRAAEAAAEAEAKAAAAAKKAKSKKQKAVEEALQVYDFSSDDDSDDEEVQTLSRRLADKAHVTNPGVQSPEAHAARSRTSKAAGVGRKRPAARKAKRAAAADDEDEDDDFALPDSPSMKSPEPKARPGRRRAAAAAKKIQYVELESDDEDEEEYDDDDGSDFEC